MAKEKEIGVVSNYFEHVGAASIKLSAGLKVGDKIKVKGGETEFEQEVKEMQIERADVKSAKAGEEPGVMLEQKVRKGYKVYKV
jgi:U32 family peptidase